MLSRFLSHLDIFKDHFFLYYEGKSKRSSPIGIVFSILIITFLIFQFVNSDIFYKLSPNVVIQSLQMPETAKIDFNDKVPFAIGVADRVTLEKFNDPTIFSVIISYYNNYMQSIVETTTCPRDYLNYNEAESIRLQIDKLICIKNKTFSLHGYASDPNFSFLQIYVIPCNNFTSNGSCKSSEEINAFFKDKVFSIGYQNSQLDVNDYKNPFKTTFDPLGLVFDSSLIKTNLVYFKTADIITDDGWIFTNYNKETNFMYEKNELDYELRTNPLDPVMKWTLIASKEKIICNRRYQKLPEALASLSGILQFAMILFLIITNLVTYVSTLKHVLNQLYYFEKIEKNTENHKKNNIKNQEQNQEDGKKINTFELIPSIFKKSRKDTIKDTIITNGPNLNLSEISIKPIDLKDFESLKNINKTEQTYNISTLSPLNKRNLAIKDDECLMTENNKNVNIEVQSSVTKNFDNEPRKTLNKINVKLLKERDNDSFYLSIFEYIIYLIRRLICSKKNQKEKLIEKAEKIYHSEMDIVNIVKKLHEIENLKLLLLDKDQLVLFNYLTKPYISLTKKIEEENTPFRRRFSQSIINKENNKYFGNSYDFCKKNKEISIINKKLVDFCDQKEISMMA